jgi:hypothetical protein
MKKLMLLALLSLPLLATAAWQIETPARGASLPPGKTVLGYPNHYNSQFILSLKKGDTLEDTVKRFANENAWKVIWKMKHPYYVLLQTPIEGVSFVEVMNTLLAHYTLHVTYEFDFPNKECTMTVTD